jgi:hypothetical protein
MRCCQCEGIEREFNAEGAESEIDEYRTEGPTETTQFLIDALTDQGVEGLTLLDIGGGVGAIQPARVLRLRLRLPPPLQMPPKMKRWNLVGASGLSSSTAILLSWLTSFRRTISLPSIA